MVQVPLGWDGLGCTAALHGCSCRNECAEKVSSAVPGLQPQARLMAAGRGWPSLRLPDDVRQTTREVIMRRVCAVSSIHGQGSKVSKLFRSQSNREGKNELRQCTNPRRLQKYRNKNVAACRANSSHSDPSLLFARIQLHVLCYVPSDNALETSFHSPPLCVCSHG